MSIVPVKSSTERSKGSPSFESKRTFLLACLWLDSWRLVGLISFVGCWGCLSRDAMRCVWLAALPALLSGGENPWLPGASASTGNRRDCSCGKTSDRETGNRSWWHPGGGAAPRGLPSARIFRHPLSTLLLEVGVPRSNSNEIRRKSAQSAE